MAFNILLLDNYDSFTYMLKDYIEQCGVTCEVIRNDVSGLVEKVGQYDALVLSPGPKTPSDAGLMNEVIAKWHLHKPMLGICLGHQAIGQYFGANLQQATMPKHGKTDKVKHVQHPLFKGIPEYFNVTRYHSLILTKVESPLRQIALGSQYECMALMHNTLPLFGMQFHPESCLTEFGLTIIKNYIELVKQPF